MGHINEHGQSLSKAGVSGMAGDQGARTGDAATGLVSSFDPAAAQKKMAAQLAVTQAFSAVAPKAVAEFAGWQQQQATQQLQGLSQEPESAARGQMTQEAKDQLEGWKEGGKYRVAAHTLAGMLGAGWQGAVGAGSSAALQDPLASLQANVLGGLKDAGFSTDMAHMLSQLSVQAGASVLGGTLSGWSGAQWSNSVDVNNRQLHDDEKQKLRKLAQQLAQEAPEQQRANATSRWYRMLHQTAYAAVDEQENAEWASHLNDVEQTRQSGLEGAYNAQAYFDNAAQAQQIIQGLAAEQQSITTPTGLITAFQATPAEFANHGLLSTLLTGGQDSLLAERRQNTLARYNARTGAVQPDYPVEEFVAGGLVGKVASQVLGGAVRGGVAAGAVEVRVGVRGGWDNGVANAMSSARSRPVANFVLYESRIGWGHKGQGSGNKIDQLSDRLVLDSSGMNIPVRPTQPTGPFVTQEFPAAPLAHGFPNMVDNYAGDATFFSLNSGPKLYQVEGSLNGVSGGFEWIVDANMGGVTHRMFVKGGAINGIPVKP